MVFFQPRQSPVIPGDNREVAILAMDFQYGKYYFAAFGLQGGFCGYRLHQHLTVNRFQHKLTGRSVGYQKEAMLEGYERGTLRREFRLTVPQKLQGFLIPIA